MQFYLWTWLCQTNTMYNFFKMNLVVLMGKVLSHLKMEKNCSREITRILVIYNQGITVKSLDYRDKN
jgi:hypothetical protein